MQGSKAVCNVGVAIPAMLDMENQNVVFHVLEMMNSFVVGIGTTLCMR